jgi:hypothetical protein
VASGLSKPTSIAFLGPNDILVLEKIPVLYGGPRMTESVLYLVKNTTISNADSDNL